MKWRDLSDDELHARLAQRSRVTRPEFVVPELVERRDDPEVAEIIDDWLVD